MRSMFFFAALALWPVLDPGSARSQAVIATGESFVQVSLLPGRAEAGGVRVVGLVLDIKPGWKTYWRDPGGVGIPPRFDWSRSRNLGAVEVLWPRPYFFESFGLTTVGYSGRVVFPVRLVPEQPDQAMEIGLNIALGVCREICVLEETTVELRIEPGAPDAGAALVAMAEAAVPRPGAEMGLAGATCRISGAGARRRFDAVLDFAQALQDPVVILEGPDLTWFTGVETTTESGPESGPESGGEQGGSGLHVQATLSLLDETVWIDRSQIRMTVLAGDFAADVKGCTAPAG